jgi:uncharacterized coiled-coil DUF342 family protein
MSDAALALIAALAGGSVLKVIEYWLNRGKAEVDEQSRYRDELRKDIDTLRVELTKTQTELDSWREKYFSVRDQLSEAVAQIKQELEKNE